MKRFEEFNVGDVDVFKHKITQQDIEKFINLTQDDNKLHVDDQFAARTILKRRVAHGMLSASFISTVIGTKLPGDGALWLSQNLNFLLPVRIGDEITIKAMVIRKIDRERVLEIKTDIFNQNKEKVTDGTAMVKVLELKKTKRHLTSEKTPRVALVLGSTGGIGRETCIALAKAGFDIAMHFFSNESFAQKLKKEISALGKQAFLVKADILDPFQIASMMDQVVRKFSTITAFVNCATIKISSIKFPQIEWFDLCTQLEAHLKSSFLVIKRLLPLMEKQKYGKIVHILSQAIETPNSDWLHYITAKSALSGFSKALAYELGPKGIRVNLVSPSLTETELTSTIPEKVRLLTEAKTPLKRLASPKDIADSICFLLSRESDFLTGETLRVNGGQTMI